ASAPLGSFLAARIGLRAVMIIGAIPTLLSLFFVAGLKEKSKPKKKKEPYFTMLFRGVRYFWQHRILRILAFDNVSLTIIMFFSIWVYAPVLQNLGMPLSWLGLASAALVGARALFLQHISKIERLFPSKKAYLMISAIVPSLCFLALPFVRSAWLGLFLLIIIAGMGMTRPSLFDHYNNIFIPSKLRATVLSAIAMLAVLGIAVFSPVVGMLAEKSMDIALFSLGGAGLLFSLLSRVEEGHLID
ncbi:MFS transporter, partial [Candidatus Woesearchaeota archaeon]|nr:MFS transporter [Candidatus Woesearchaeota archaeon]